MKILCKYPHQKCIREANHFHRIEINGHRDKPNYLYYCRCSVHVVTWMSTIDECPREEYELHEILEG